MYIYKLFNPFKKKGWILFCDNGILYIVYKERNDLHGYE